MSEINPADIGGGSSKLSDEFSRETPDEDLPGPVKKPEREGLPPSYRMRADAHYVDQLSTPRTESVRSSRRATPAPLEDVPDVRDRREARDLRTERLLAQLSEDLASVESSVAALAAGASPTARRVMLDVARAHTWRASWLVRAQAVAEGPSTRNVRSRPISSMLSRLRDGFAAECRLNSVTLHVHVPDWNAAVAIDEQELVVGLTGAVVAVVGLLGDSDGATVKVTASVSGGELRAVEISQDEALVPSAVAGRFFDPISADRPGGWVAGFGAWTARTIAQRLGGDATLVAGDRRGCTLRLSFERPA